jgi:hypothetical protein
MRFGDRPWSALQTHLQGVDRAAMTAVIKELDHAAPPFQADEPGFFLPAAPAGGNPIARDARLSSLPGENARPQDQAAREFHDSRCRLCRFITFQVTLSIV